MDLGHIPLTTSSCKCDHNPQKCFPALTNIKLQNGTSIAMSELTVGDKVQTGIKSLTLSQLIFMYGTQAAIQP